MVKNTTDNSKISTRIKMPNPGVDTFIIVDKYPSEDDLYAYAFVHARVKAYMDSGLKVAVFYLDGSAIAGHSYEFEGVSVIRGDDALLGKVLKASAPKSISVHFLTPYIWGTVIDYADKIPVYVWIHGSEIQDWLRRHFAFNDMSERLSAIRGYRSRHSFWSNLFEDSIYKLHFIFVSQYFADEVMEDIGIAIDKSKYSIIHNFIDTDLFKYVKKSPDQRKHILTVRPFSSAKYANDLTVKAILDLKKEPYFKELNFTIAGDGDFFDDITEPIKDFDNVTLVNKFLTQQDIAKLHKNHGVFINPTRMDAQGVSRDEAMSSGLVPVTSNNTAIPEFVSQKEGYLVETEDYKGLADAIRDMYNNPKVFSEKSEASAKWVRQQSGFKQTIQAEIDLISSKKPSNNQVNDKHVFKDALTEKEQILRTALFDVIDDNQSRETKELRDEIKRIKESGAYKLGLKTSTTLRRVYNNRVFNVPAKATLSVIKKVRNGKDVGPKNKPRRKVGKFYIDTTKKNLTIATVVDTFTYESFKHEATIRQLSRNNWRNEITDKVDMLFVESAWRGVNDSWKDIVDKTPPELVSLVLYCREKSIPTVFWNKEDPMHTDRFMRTAELFDFVFTTDVNVVNKYKKELGHNRIYSLPFAAQPRVNNPIEVYDRVDAVSFAGSYYPEYPDRNVDFQKLTDEILKYKKLAIYDRNYDLGVRQFPDQYQEYIKGTLSFDQIDKAYKGYKYAITINTVKGSPTMFARRAFELLLSNTITIGNYALGVKEMLGGLVVMPNEEGKFGNRVSNILTSNEIAREMRLKGIRTVLENHTYEERLDRILGKVFRNYSPQHNTPKTTVVSLISSVDEFESVSKYFNNQVHSNKNLFVLVKDEKVKQVINGDSNIFIIDVSKKKSLPASVKQEVGEYIAAFNPNSYYGHHYLYDAVLATKYSNAKIIGRASYYSSKNGTLKLLREDSQYKEGVSLGAENAIISSKLLKISNTDNLLDVAESAKVYKESTLSIDGFSYSDAIITDKSQEDSINADTHDVDTGVPISEFYKQIDRKHNLFSIKRK